jgi:hypothetical protein
MKFGAIVIGCTFVAFTIINGIFGLPIPLSKQYVTTYNAPKYLSTIRTPTDTIAIRSILNFSFEIEDGDTTKYVYPPGFWANSSTDFSKISVVFINPQDSTSVPRYEKYKEKRVSNSRWISDKGLPGGEIEWTVYMLNDSTNREAVKIATECFGSFKSVTNQLQASL